MRVKGTLNEVVLGTLHKYILIKTINYSNELFQLVMMLASVMTKDRTN